LINKSPIINHQSSIRLRPMLASLADAPLDDPHLVYEPKYDGIRAIVEIDPQGAVRIWSRLGNDKTQQFPEIASALESWARRRKAPRPALVLDGEIVALDRNGQPGGFQQLQGRIHLTEGGGGATALIAFDLLREGNTDLRGRGLLDRRAALERLFSSATTGPTGTIRLSETTRDGRSMYQRALESGWEGLIAKRDDSVYQSDKRTPDWRKLKIVHEQEFVIGGWTEPRQTRSYFGALLLGVYEGDHRGATGRKAQGRKSQPPAPSPDLIYVGHTGTGFNERELSRVMKLLKAVEIKDPPFRERPRTNERPHWVKPVLVAQIKFTEWTADGKLRHPVYLGLREDKRPEDVIRESKARLSPGTAQRVQGSGFSVQGSVQGSKGSVQGSVRGSKGSVQRSVRKNPEPTEPLNPEPLLTHLRELEAGRKNGVLELAGGHRLNVTNLHKVFWPKLKLTKGDLFRYYVEVAPYVLPAIADRPLVMKRFPNGVDAPPFYQHRAQDVPAGVRVKTVSVAETRQQIIGGDLMTLLYMTQLAAISQDPWFSRVQTVQSADYVALDLDPSEGVKFDRVLDVARAIKDELDVLGVVGVPKTSGADGLHIYIPLPPGTPYDAGLLFCQIIATVVAQKHPKIATVERSVRARGPRVYVDYLQNVLGKTLATAYSARASQYAGVSAPLTWKEVDAGIHREDFTIKTMPARVKKVGDLWAALRNGKPADLTRVTRYQTAAGRGARSTSGRSTRKS
jgi:bifunctional non-homologous end joining protein LigD